MDKKIITAKFTNNNIEFYIEKDLFNDDTFYSYSLTAEGFKASRIGSPEHSKTTVTFDNLHLYNCSGHNWWLNFSDPLSEDNSFTMIRENEKITLISTTQEKQTFFVSEQVLLNARELSQNKCFETAKQLYGELVNANYTLFERIKDKETFEEQMVSYLEDSIIEAQKQKDQDILDDIKINFKNYIETFILSEQEIPVLETLYTPDYFLKKYNSIMEDYPSTFNKQEVIAAVLVKQKFIPDILFSKDEFEHDIINDIIDEFDRKIDKREIILNKYSNDYIYQKYKQKYLKIQDKSFFQSSLRNALSYKFSFRFQPEEDIDAFISAYIDDYLQKESEYNKFIAEYGSNKVSINLTPEKIEQFTNYSSLGTTLPSDLFKEYQTYALLMPEYNRFIFTKNGKRVRPSIRELPKIINYCKELLSLLVKSDILCYQNNKIIYNSLNNINVFAKDLYQFEKTYKM